MFTLVFVKKKSVCSNLLEGRGRIPPPTFRVSIWMREVTVLEMVNVSNLKVSV